MEWGRARHLVASGADALLNDHVVHRLIVHTQDLCGAKLLVVGGLAVCQAGSILHAGWRACSTTHKGYQFSSKAQGLPMFIKNTAAKSVDVIRLAVCQASSILHAGRCIGSKTQGLPIFQKQLKQSSKAAKSLDVVGLAVCQAGSILHAGRCA